MSDILRVISIVLGVCCVLMFFAFRQTVLVIVPPANDNVQLTSQNHDSFQMIVKFNHKLKNLPENVDKDFYEMYTGITTIRPKDEWILRSVDNEVYMIQRKDDSKFTRTNIFGINVTKNNKAKFAIKFCKNNGSGCGVKPAITYHYYNEWFVSPYRITYDIDRRTFK